MDEATINKCKVYIFNVNRFNLKRVNIWKIAAVNCF